MAFQVVAKERIVDEIKRAVATFPRLPADEIHTLVAASLGAPVESVREIAAAINHEGSSC